MTNVSTASLPADVDVVHSLRFTNGECLSAMERYRRVFGGELKFMTYREADIDVANPDLVCWSDLVIRQDMRLVGSDSVDETVIQGTNQSVMILCSDLEWATDVFTKLGFDGRIIQPLGYCEWGTDFGMLVDRFGIHWTFNVSPPAFVREARKPKEV